MNFKDYFTTQKGLTAQQYDDLRFNHHQEFYQMIIKELGYPRVKACVPATLKELKASKDKYFNDIPIKRWDVASGFNTNGGQCKYIGSFLTSLYRKIGVTSSSCSIGVCILKECARMWINEG